MCLVHIQSAMRIASRPTLFPYTTLFRSGRVGRSNKKAFCYLLTPPASLLTADSRKRLSALEEFSELGDGFKVDRKSTRLNSSHLVISYAVFCLKKKKENEVHTVDSIKRH